MILQAVQALIAEPRSSPPDAVRRAVQPGGDIDVLHPLGGIEDQPRDKYTSQPTARQRKLARVALAAGATAVIGGHPHVLQPLHRSGKHGLIAYSLGNFVFHPRNTWASRTGILQLDISARGIERQRFRRAVIHGVSPQLR